MTHAKAIFFGEHSVVYGKIGISIPLLEMTISVKLEETNKIQKRDEILTYICNECNIKNTTKVLINSKIPVGRGLGSSAALSVAIAKANGCKNIKEIADNCEKFIHGNPSGIDVNQVLSNKPLIFSKNDGAKEIDFKLDCYLLIIDTGVIGITKETVQSVKNNIKNNEKYINKLGEITNKVIPYLLSKNIKKIGKMMNYSHNLLQKINVSHKTNDEIVKICNDNNALGAKITGGGNGGCCIALVEDLTTSKKIQNKLKERGYLSWIVSV